ncbi:hypothetical protein NL676_009916 [Syzygium grande]|nr:hypothetical protein NL676_009916 [Syzygium grande]
MASGVKASCTLVASVLAASTAAFSSSAPAAADRSPSLRARPNGVGCSSTYSNEKELGAAVMGSSASSAEEVKLFAPRFDGLRFIETLVTAHR